MPVFFWKNARILFGECPYSFRRMPVFYIKDHPSFACKLTKILAKEKRLSFFCSYSFLGRPPLRPFSLLMRDSVAASFRAHSSTFSLYT